MSSKHVSRGPDPTVAAAVAPTLRQPGVADRFGATLTLALIAHGILILGIGFAVDRPATVRPTLDIILSHTRSESEPEQADFLARSNQRGGGESERAERPRAPQSAAIESLEPGAAPEPTIEQAPSPSVAELTTIVSTEGQTRSPDAEAEPTLETDLPLGAELAEMRLEMARLAAEIEREQELLAKSPNRKFVSASTREFEWAGYVGDWVRRVERIGNLNYPDEVRRRRLAGSLVLTVAVARDGSVQSIDVVRSSGQPLLDEAAIRTVRLAQPFAPLPQNSENVDVLHITRTWQYLADGRLQQRP